RDCVEHSASKVVVGVRGGTESTRNILEGALHRLQCASVQLYCDHAGRTTERCAASRAGVLCYQCRAGWVRHIHDLDTAVTCCQVGEVVTHHHAPAVLVTDISRTSKYPKQRGSAGVGHVEDLKAIPTIGNIKEISNLGLVPQSAGGEVPTDARWVG